MDVREPTDAELMLRVKAGDRGAFAAVVDRYKDSLVAYLSRMTRNAERAEELAQDAFVRLYESAGSYREQGRLGGYLYRIATNLLLSEERRERRFRLLQPLLGTNGDNGAGPPTPQRCLLGEEATAAVSGALSRLPMRYRAPLVLREIEGLSYREIAAALDCREGTVKSRINRGRERLRTLLEPYWNGERG
jgi:RNA polymerase sigma-70 factor (ECF subfamily)